MKVSIDLGVTAGGGPAALDLEELLATRLLVQGNSGSGKSHLLRRLLEQSAPWVQQTVIDPEGDFVTLAERFGHVVVDAADHSEAALQRIAGRVRAHRVSVVLDIEGLDVERQMRRSAAFLGGLFEVDRDHWYPMLVVVDEAQLFAPSAAGDIGEDARKISLGAMTNLMCRGRKRGLAGVIATQRLAKLAKNVAAEASNFLMGRTFLDIDMARAADLLGMERRQAEMFRDLERGHFVALGPALSRRSMTVTIGPVETAGRSGSPTLLPLPETSRDAATALILTPGEVEDTPPPPVRRPAPVTTAALLSSLAQARPALRPAVAEATAETLSAFDAILREILADADAGFRTVAVLYQDFQVRARIAGLRGEGLDLAAFRRRLAVARAGAGAVTAGSADWDTALTAAADLPEDVQTVFLLLARAALEQAPCPSDAAVARVFGSHSPRRARRLLEFIEAKGFITTREERDGRRVIVVACLGCETAPGDPNRADPLPPGGLSAVG